jgi:hypothetical protein
MVLAMVPVSFYSYPYHMLPDNHTLVDVMVLVFGPYVAWITTEGIKYRQSRGME